MAGAIESPIIAECTRHLSQWVKWRNFVRNLNIVFVKNISYIKINRRNVVQNLNVIAKRMHYKMHKLDTPSTGGELAGAEPTQPPRQAELDTPPQEGNCWCRTYTTTPSGYARHPSKGGELLRWFV